MLDNKEYAAAVDAEQYPAEPAVPLGTAFIDHRGQIVNVLHTPITSVARIVSKRGSTRANHWHRTDWHYAFVETGKVLYFERAIGSTEIPEPQVFERGSMFFTPPNREHCMLFAEDSVIYTFAKNVRSHENHEADVVRVEFITPDIARKYLANP